MTINPIEFLESLLGSYSPETDDNGNILYYYRYDDFDNIEKLSVDDFEELIKEYDSLLL